MLELGTRNKIALRGNLKYKEISVGYENNCILIQFVLWFIKWIYASITWLDRVEPRIQW